MTRDSSAGPEEIRRPPGGLTLSVIVPVYNERLLVGALLRRLLDLRLDAVDDLEILVVDDGSSDGSGELLQALADQHPERIRLFRRDRNRGKGAAIRRGIEAATGDLTVIQDADLEYDPRDFSRMLQPFLESDADVVYGSRFLAGENRRDLHFRHHLGNRLITFVSNRFTGLELTDVETCYKMFRTSLLKSLPLRSDGFSIEIELTAKAAKREWVIFEVPVRFFGRTYEEGKKIGLWDGFKALGAIVRFFLIDDLHRDGAGGDTTRSRPDPPLPSAPRWPPRSRRVSGRTPSRSAGDSVTR